MHTKGVKYLVKNLGGVISKNSPAILSGLAVAGVVSTTILAVQATPKAMQLIKEEVYENLSQEDPYPELTNLEKVKLCWKCYIPAGVSAAMTIACIIALNKVHIRRQAAVASLYQLTDTAFREYQAKIVETLGKNKEQKARDEIIGEKLKENPVDSNTVIFTKKGDVLCYDMLSGRYFRSDIEQIRRIVNRLNKNLMNDMFVPLNDLYFELGLPLIKLGDDMGWNVDNGLFEITFSSQISSEGEPCLVLNCDVVPKYK